MEVFSASGIDAVVTLTSPLRDVLPGSFSKMALGLPILQSIGIAWSINRRLIPLSVWRDLDPGLVSYPERFLSVPCADLAIMRSTEISLGPTPC